MTTFIRLGVDLPLGHGSPGRYDPDVPAAVTDRPQRLAGEVGGIEDGVVGAFHLGESDMRYAELNRRIAGVSQKMLTQALRNLERDGLVTRTVAPTVPVSVTYSLTELGHGLHEVLQGIKHWAEEAAAEIIIARDRYDAD